MLKKWHQKGTFSEKFWRHIASKIGSESDFGVFTFSNVETVLKKVEKCDTTKGWRLVWKASSLCEKLYDLLKAMSMEISELNNDAYCVNRSTQKTLAKVCAWPVSENEVLLGCDYQNAFALACRPCINELLDCDYLNPEIHFQVVTDAGVSVLEVSVTGSGAGRATGGPGFNLLFNHHITENLVLKAIRDKMAEFADDSQAKIKRAREAIKQVILAFMEGSRYGLFMHCVGDKGPTVLTRKSDIENLDNLLNVPKLVPGVQINVVGEVKFLGVQIKICADFNCVVASLTSEVTKTLSFFISELNRNVRILSSNTNYSSLTKQFEAFSFAVSSTIESRIQYSIAFLDAESLYQVVDFHKRVICAMAGKPFRFFGFKKCAQKQTGFVRNLYEFLDDLMPKSYKKLCMALGRPTILQIALRAVSVINQQVNYADLIEQLNHGSRLRGRNNFVSKMKDFTEKCSKNGITNKPPRDNEYFKSFQKLRTFQKRRNFLKALTDNLLLDHLKSKGWYRKDMGCRVDGLYIESVAHVLEAHVDDKLLHPGTRRDLGRMRRIEILAGEKRKVLIPSCKAALVLVDVFGEVKEPYLKLSKKSKDGVEKPPQKRRRKN